MKVEINYILKGLVNGPVCITAKLARFTDTHFIWTLRSYGQSAVSLNV